MFSVTGWGENLYAFAFEGKTDIDMIMNMAPWSPTDNLMFLEEWNQHITIKHLNFDFSPFWIQIHGLPLDFVTKVNGQTIGRLIGLVLEVDGIGLEEDINSIFLKVRVKLNVTKPLPKGFLLKRDRIEDSWIEFKYERLLKFR